MGRSFSGERLEKLRGKKTQTDLANGLRNKGYGTTQTTVSRWESGQEPRAYILPALADELGVTVDELYGDEDDEESRPMPTQTLLETLYAELGAKLGKTGVPA